MVHIMKDMAGEQALGGAQSVDRALALLALIARHSADGISLSGLVAASELKKATARRLLLALMRAGLVEQDNETRAYHLGAETYVMGLLAQGRHGLLRQAIDQIQTLARETGDAAFLSVRRGLHSVCLHREDGAHPIRTYALLPGGHHPLGVGAGSLAMLAALPDPQIDDIIASNTPELSANYPRLTPAILRDHIAQTRESGIALNPGLIFEDSWGLGIALHGPDGHVVGALSLAAVESRMKETRRPELTEKLRVAARITEARLGSRQQEKRT